ncbi:MAG: UDP-glucose 4-epimerase GalE [Planctomycetota bacterium]|nr:UDP-glucose 4-epimerase GalE [Planctomycetota bacterium]
MNLLVTGGAGYIGSHAVQQLLALGHRVVVIDDLFRGHRRALELLGLGTNSALQFVQGSITDTAAVEAAFSLARPDAVLHFAALAYVGESVDQPLRYADVNIGGLGCVLAACGRHNVSRLVFSSSCSTYGNPPAGMIPVPEGCPQAPVSPYGRTKLVGEWIIRDFAAAQRRANRPFACAFLRYFNVCGCDSSGLLGEDHTPESHLIPILMQVAMGQRPFAELFGTDYPTPDGTCVRDYVHVEDLIAAHILAIDKLAPGEERAYNVGIGRGYSVREIMDAARRVTGHPIPVREGPRRAGDAAMLFNDSRAVMSDLGWKPRHTDLDAIIRTAWTWFSRHPDGYRSSR